MLNERYKEHKNNDDDDDDDGIVVLSCDALQTQVYINISTFRRSNVSIFRSEAKGRFCFEGWHVPTSLLRTSKPKEQ